MCRAGQRKGPLHLNHGSIWDLSSSDLELLQLRDASISKQRTIRETRRRSALLYSALFGCCVNALLHANHEAGEGRLRGKRGEIAIKNQMSTWEAIRNQQNAMGSGGRHGNNVSADQKLMMRERVSLWKKR